MPKKKNETEFESEEVELAVADETIDEKGQEKNIIFVGEGEPTRKITGVFRTTLPDAETQKAGWHHKDARQIIALFPKQYKKFVRKGDK